MNDGMYKAIDIIDDTHSQYVDDGELAQDIEECGDMTRVLDLAKEIYNLLTPKKKIILDMDLDDIQDSIKLNINCMVESMVSEYSDKIKDEINKEIGEVSDIWLFDPSRESSLKKYDKDGKKTQDDFEKHKKKLRDNGELL